jgi:Cu(I)/Ag(I) efflux system protein CusF
MFAQANARSRKAYTNMKSIHLAVIAATLAVVSACNREEPSNNQTQGEQPGQIYSGTGTVQSISGIQVAIAHGPISSIGWPAMTMTFTVPPGMAQGVQTGNKVDFSFRHDGSAYVLTSLHKL